LVNECPNLETAFPKRYLEHWKIKFILAKYLVTTIVWLSLLCTFYECSGSWYL